MSISIDIQSRKNLELHNLIEQGKALATNARTYVYIENREGGAKVGQEHISMLSNKINIIKEKVVAEKLERLKNEHPTLCSRLQKKENSNEFWLPKSLLFFVTALFDSLFSKDKNPPDYVNNIAKLERVIYDMEETIKDI